MSITVREIRALLQDRVEDLCRQFLPEGRREGTTWVAKNPNRDDRKAGSFKVWLHGEARGAFVDYATDEKGDVIDLIAFCRRSDRKDAIAFAKDFLGIARMDDRAREHIRARVKREADRAQEEEDNRLRWRRKKALEKFKSGHPDLTGTPAETYFRARGTPLHEIPNLSKNTYRFHPSCEWWKGRQYEERNGRRELLRRGPTFPAILSALRNAHGGFTGLHATFLLPDGSGKAGVEPAKLMFGTAKGSVIRVSDGGGGKSPEDFAAPGPLIITEGNEDGWAAALALPEARVWAAGSLTAIADAPVFLDCVSEIYVARQDDRGNAQATDAVERAIALLEEHGKPVAAIDSFGGHKDLNDIMRAGAA